MKKTWFAPSAEMLDCDGKDVICTSVGVSDLWDCSGDDHSVDWKELK